ncbi:MULTISPECIES: hypothetical protein [Lactococcus]|jgi:hypothetical protein|uniref:Uncharacterized protein n=2 Tax=Lactococcus lactis TaxID=1358 RepID=A0A2Z3KDV7_LACLL|nr:MULTISPECIES: hypothetical protein [Lactococcus]AWN65840.1 hypothetical protein LL14B4_06495 [Lactococcus lactis subsp. lactis]MBK0028779.1 hypothetical protein [Lactococcus sp. S47]MCG1001125.1 hypothetical protein [Lactococcus lactis]MCT0439651.1 hypothetical protein [Lactococcus lactis subsp. lactis]MCT2919123.1 hypothetical protein [Lactococcus lactis]
MKESENKIRNMLVKVGFSEISDVFVIPQRKVFIGKNKIFYNYYPLCFKNNLNNKVYYLRSKGDSFCITPTQLLKFKRSAVFSIGKGIDDGKEKAIILVEASSSNRKFVAEKNEQLREKLKEFSFAAYKINIVEEFGKYWLRVWIIMK